MTVIPHRGFYGHLVRRTTIQGLPNFCGDRYRTPRWNSVPPMVAIKKLLWPQPRDMPYTAIHAPLSANTDGRWGRYQIIVSATCGPWICTLAYDRTTLKQMNKYGPRATERSRNPACSAGSASSSQRPVSTTGRRSRSSSSPQDRTLVLVTTAVLSRLLLLALLAKPPVKKPQSHLSTSTVLSFIAEAGKRFFSSPYVQQRRDSRQV